jgi:hypothetical protein
MAIVSLSDGPHPIVWWPASVFRIRPAMRMRAEFYALWRQALAALPGAGTPSPDDGFGCHAGFCLPISYAKQVEPLKRYRNQSATR